MQTVHITSKIASSNPAVGEVYSLEHYVIEFVSDLRQDCCFLRILQFLLQIKLIATYLTGILLNGIRHHNNNLNPTNIYLYTPTVIITQK